MEPDRTRWGDSRLDDLARDLRELREDFGEYVEDQRKANETQRLEHKTDRRWMVGTVLTSAGLVIAAMALLIGHIG